MNIMEKMLSDETEYDLSKLLYSYIINDKLVDEKFIIDSFKIIYSLNDLNGYLNGVRFKKMPQGEVADYNFKTKTITIDSSIIGKSNQRLDLLENNILILDLIFHEVCHAFQVKKTNQEDNLESQLLKLDFNLKDETNEKNFSDFFWKTIYEKLYLCFPSERLAIYNSFSTIIDLLKIIKLSNGSKYIDECYYSCFFDLNESYTYKNNGKTLFSPIEKFTIVHDKVKPLDPFINKELIYYLNRSKLSLKEKFVYGLPVSNREYKKLEKKFCLLK